MRKLLNTHLGIFPGLADTRKIADTLLISKAHTAELINQLILYDQIVIPTSNLGILPVLRNWIGDQYFDFLIRENIIVLARHDYWLSYLGNGGGLNFYQIRPGEHKVDIGWGQAAFLPLDQILPVVISQTTPPSSPQRSKELEQLLADKIISVPVEESKEKLRHETYTDIIGSRILRSLFLSRYPDGVYLDKLTGVDTNQAVIYCPHLVEDSYKTHPEINTVFHIAFQNFIFNFGTEIGATDIQATDTTFRVYKAKGERFGLDDARLEQFSSIFDVEGIPSIGNAFVDGIIDMAEIIKIRESTRTENFRQWFEDSLKENTTDVVQDYLDSLKGPTWINRIPVKTMRIGLQATIGAVAGLLGDPGATATLLSTADSFLLEKWAGQSPPKLFIDDVKHVMLEPEKKIVQKTSTPGRLRNKPCPCGSGKKFKRCCGK